MDEVASFPVRAKFQLLICAFKDIALHDMPLPGAGSNDVVLLGTIRNNAPSRAEHAVLSR